MNSGDWFRRWLNKDNTVEQKIVSMALFFTVCLLGLALAIASMEVAR
jgi:hypothetical protein